VGEQQAVGDGHAAAGALCVQAQARAHAQAGQLARELQVWASEQKRGKRRARGNMRQAKLPRQPGDGVAAAQGGPGRAAQGQHHARGEQRAVDRIHREQAALFLGGDDADHGAAQKEAAPGLAAGLFKGQGQGLGALVAEHLALVLLPGRKAEPLQQVQKLRGRKALERLGRKARIGGNVVLWRGVLVGAVAPPPAGGAQLAGRGAVLVDQQNLARGLVFLGAAGCGEGAEHPGRASAQDEDVGVGLLRRRRGGGVFGHGAVVGDARREHKCRAKLRPRARQTLCILPELC